jgi:DNA-binding MarR family transcriptional regulator
MSPAQALETAREILHVMPLVMRTVVAGLRSAGELPAPAHFPLLVILKEQSRTLSELAELRGVSLPTMSNSISALVQRGLVRRVGAAASFGTVGGAERSKGSRHRNGTTPVNRLPDRRVVFVEATPAGLAALDRVERAAERHLADVLGPLDLASRRRLTAGFSVLKRLFDAPPPAGSNRRRREPSGRVTRT